MIPKLSRMLLKPSGSRIEGKGERDLGISTVQAKRVKDCRGGGASRAWPGRPSAPLGPMGAVEVILGLSRMDKDDLGISSISIQGLRVGKRIWAFLGISMV